MKRQTYLPKPEAWDGTYKNPSIRRVPAGVALNWKQYSFFFENLGRGPTQGRRDRRGQSARSGADDGDPRALGHLPRPAQRIHQIERAHLLRIDRRVFGRCETSKAAYG